MTKRNHKPSLPLPRGAFERELTTVVSGDSDAAPLACRDGESA